MQLLLVFACDSFPGGQARISYSHLYATTALDKWPENWLNFLPPLIQRTAVPLKDVLCCQLGLLNAQSHSTLKHLKMFPREIRGMHWSHTPRGVVSGLRLRQSRGAPLPFLPRGVGQVSNSSLVGVRTFSSDTVSFSVSASYTACVRP